MNSVNEILTYSGIVIAILVFFAVAKTEKSDGFKLFLFWGMTIPIIFSTFYLAGATVWENNRSVTHGPVHWHADFQIHFCGQLVDLENPRGLVNRIGTPVLHEHGDNRIHVEGTVARFEDVSLGNFFSVIGGTLTQKSLRVPTTVGQQEVENGMTCPDSKTGTLQIFAYQVRDNVIYQEKLRDLPGYVLSGHSRVPPGDCIIIEFGPVKSKTEHICNFYQIAINNGELTYDRN